MSVTVLYEIFKPDHKVVTLMLQVDASVKTILSTLVDPDSNYFLVKMNSSGGKTTDSCVMSVCWKYHVVLSGCIY